MAAPASPPISSIWQRWKSLKLPWRKRWLAGTDLSGNKYWYFNPTRSPQPRRILQNNPQIPYSDIQIPPQWHQWLRHTRASPPSLQEQQLDVLRQQQLKQLARAADERWAAKPSVLDRPRRGNGEVRVGDGEAEGTVGRRWEEGEKTGGRKVGMGEGNEGERRERENPWKRERGAAGEGFKPEAWRPGPVKR